eukprot:1433035-Karenia_brevis.AAC.1
MDVKSTRCVVRKKGEEIFLAESGADHKLYGAPAWLIFARAVWDKCSVMNLEKFQNSYHLHKVTVPVAEKYLQKFPVNKKEAEKGTFIFGWQFSNVTLLTPPYLVPSNRETLWGKVLLSDAV